MTRFLTTRRLGILFASLFALALVGVFGYQRLFLDPEQKCEASGRWWYEEGGECVTPMYLPEQTGRPAGVTRAEWSEQKARELVEIEHRLAAEKAARQAQTDRDRALVEKNSGL